LRGGQGGGAGVGGNNNPKPTKKPTQLKRKCTQGWALDVKGPMPGTEQKKRLQENYGKNRKVLLRGRSWGGGKLLSSPSFIL